MGQGVLLGVGLDGTEAARPGVHGRAPQLMDADPHAGELLDHGRTRDEGEGVVGHHHQVGEAEDEGRAGDGRAGHHDDDGHDARAPGQAPGRLAPAVQRGHAVGDVGPARRQYQDDGDPERQRRGRRRPHGLAVLHREGAPPERGDRAHHHGRSAAELLDTRPAPCPGRAAGGWGPTGHREREALRWSPAHARDRTAGPTGPPVTWDRVRRPRAGRRCRGDGPRGPVRGGRPPGPSLPGPSGSAVSEVPRLRTPEVLHPGSGAEPGPIDSESTPDDLPAARSTRSNCRSTSAQTSGSSAASSSSDRGARDSTTAPTMSRTKSIDSLDTNPAICWSLSGRRPTAAWDRAKTG